MRKIANAACFVLRAVVLCPRRAPELSKCWPSLAVDSEAGSSTGRLQSSATIPYWTRS